MKIRSLLVKEFKETRIQGVVFAAVLLLFGATSVLLQKFIPQLVPENLAEAFEPSLTAGLADYVGNSLQMGSIVAILITIAALAGERETGTLELLLARPVSKLQIVVSKFLARTSYVFLGNFIEGSAYRQKAHREITLLLQSLRYYRAAYAVDCIVFPCIACHTSGAG